MSDSWLLRLTTPPGQIPGMPQLGDATTAPLESVVEPLLSDSALKDIYNSGALSPELMSFVSGQPNPLADPQTILNALLGLPQEGREVGQLNGNGDPQQVADPHAALKHGGDAETKAVLQQQIEDLMKYLEANGIDLEARPGSRLDQAQKTGDYSNLTAEDLISVLQSLLGYKNNQNNPGAVAGRGNAALAPRGSWKSNGTNTYGGGGQQTGVNASSANAPTQIDTNGGAPRAPGEARAPWISQYDGSQVERAGDQACYRAARAMMAAAGHPIPAGVAGNYIPIARGEDGSGRVQTNRSEVEAGRNYIDQELAAGRPVTVGVSHKDANYNADGITDHFVVITGSGVDDQGRQFYTYNDPATQNRATGEGQRFFVDANSGNLVHQGPLASGYVVNRHTEMSMIIRN